MRKILFTTLIAVGALGACDRRKDTEPVTSNKPVEPIPSPTPAPSAEPNTMSTGGNADLDTERTDLRKWVDERVDRLNARIEELEKKGDEQSKQTAASLRAKRDQARAKLDEMGAQTRDNWQAFKKDVQDWWDQLDRDVNDATR